MKIQQIITEYRRDVTAQNLGDKLLARLGNEPLNTTPDDLYNAVQLVRMAIKPESYPPDNIRFNVVGHNILVAPHNASEFVKKLQAPILDKLLTYIESRDPTPNKVYTQWLARSWANGNDRLEDLNRNNLLGIYDAAKRRGLIQAQDRDINKWKTYKQFENTLHSQYDLDAIKNKLDPEAAARRAQAQRGEYREVYNDDKLRVIQPLDVTAACYYGKGTTWCTAGDENNAFDNYNYSGPLFILLPKKPNYAGEKYQIHLNSSQIMDEDDDSVDPTKLIDRYPEFFKLLSTKLDRENAQDWIYFADDEKIKELSERILEIAQEQADEIIWQWQQEDEWFRKSQEEEARNRGYLLYPDSNRRFEGNVEDLSNEEFDEMEIDWDRVHEDDDLNDYLQYNDDARLMMRDLKKLQEWSPRQWKYFATTTEEDYTELRHFGDLVLAAIREEVTASDLLSDYVQRRVRMDYSNKDGWYVKYNSSLREQQEHKSVFMLSKG